MRKATICVGGILCLGLAAIAGVHMYESVTTKHADAATTTATATPVNETRQAPRPPLPPRQPPMNGDDDDGDDDATPAGFGVGHASYKAAFPDAASSGPGGK